MHRYSLFFGSCDVYATTAEPEKFIQLLNEGGVHLQNVCRVDFLQLHFEIVKNDLKRLMDIAEKSGAEIRIRNREGLISTSAKILLRPIFVAGISLLLLLTLLLPTRILFVLVEGNNTLPSALIIETAETCGISFGASRRMVRSESTKNKLLSSLPQLRWAGINTYGCVAVINVQERPITEPKNASSMIQHIVAIKDATVSEVTVLRGSPNCAIGQAVKKDHVLISGYIDHGICIEATRAEGEIIGRTGNVLRILTPIDKIIRGEQLKSEVRYSILVGKKLINFCKDSGISGAECVRMYEERYLTLPGDLRLPVALIREELICTDLKTEAEDSFGSYTWVKDFATVYLQRQMLSGEILQANTFEEFDNDAYVLYGTYQCREIIGRVRSEENLIIHE